MRRLRKRVAEVTSMKKIILLVAIMASLASCGSKTVIREVQVTQAPATSAPAGNRFATTAEAIAWVREQLPLRADDSAIYEAMTRRCDLMDEQPWGAVYSILKSWFEEEDADYQNEMLTTLEAAAGSVCTRHYDDAQKILARFR